MTDAKYEIVKLSENSWRIEENGVRSFLFDGTERALLIDSGFGTGNIKEAVQTLTQQPIMLVNTHTDGDHVGCNVLFETAFMHPSEYANYFQNAPSAAKVSPLWEGDIIDLGIRQFEVILIPGHTPGSIALLDRANKLLIAGDSISGAPIFMFGKSRNFHAYICSMKKVLALSSSFDTIYAAHGPFPLQTDIVEKLIEGASRVLNGEVEGQTPPFEIPAKMFLTGDVGFFC